MRPLRPPNGQKHDGPVCVDCRMPIVHEVAFYSAKGLEVSTWKHVYKGACRRPRLEKEKPPPKRIVPLGRLDTGVTMDLTRRGKSLFTDATEC